MTISVKDNWLHKSASMLCRTCMYFVGKAQEGQIIEVGRCRKHAPTMDGWPAMFITDWCGDHKLDSDKLLVPVSTVSKVSTNNFDESLKAYSATAEDGC